MRWLFLFVLALNLSYLGWGIVNNSNDEQKDIAPLRNVKPILLLSEVKQSGAVKESLASEVVNLQNNQAKQESAASEVTEDIADVSTDAIAETSADQIDADRERVQPEMDAEIVAGCFTLGPFEDLDKLGQFVREIQPFVSAADFRGQEVKEATVYWVYLKPEKSYNKAAALGKQLKANKIKDYYIIRDGDKKFGLSLGHFRNKQGAYSLFKKVAKLGFDVGIDKIDNNKTIYWLDYELVDKASIPEALFTKYIPQNKKTEVTRKQRGCTP